MMKWFWWTNEVSTIYLQLFAQTSVWSFIFCLFYLLLNNSANNSNKIDWTELFRFYVISFLSLNDIYDNSNKYINHQSKYHLPQNIEKICFWKCRWFMDFSYDKSAELGPNLGATSDPAEFMVRIEEVSRVVYW